VHKLGQVFLKDQNIIQRIIQSIEDKEQPILEVGCGKGILTKELVKITKDLTVVELDEKWLSYTKQLVPNARFIHQDILKLDPTTLPYPMKIVANIPYYLSAKFIKWIIQYSPVFPQNIIMVQKEFSEKLTAKANHPFYTPLSIYSQFHLVMEPLFNVSKHCFSPTPKVDSTVIRITPRKKPLFNVDEAFFFKIVRSTFWGKRKPIQSALKKSPYLEKPILAVPDSFGKLRGENLSIAEFYELYLSIINPPQPT